MLSLLRRAGELPAPEARAGVAGLWDWRWPLAAALQLLAVGLLASDPFFGLDHFRWGQGVAALLAAWVLVATVALDWRLLGRPAGINLVLHGLLLFPVSLLMGRLLGPASVPRPAEGLLGQTLDLARQAADQSLTLLPDALATLLRLAGELVTAPGAVAFLLLAGLAFGLRRRRWAAGLLGCALAFALAVAAASTQPPPLAFWGGVACLAAALALQANDHRRLARQERLLQRLAGCDDAAERQAAISAGLWALEQGRLEQGRLAEFARQAWPERGQDPAQALNLSQALAWRLVRVWAVLEVVVDQRGPALVPAPALLQEGGGLGLLAILPRLLVLGLGALLYIMLPFDLVPDAVPILGVLDDAALLSLVLSPVLTDLKRLWAGGRAEG